MKSLCNLGKFKQFSYLMLYRSQDFSAAKFDDRTVIICDQV